MKTNLALCWLGTSCCTLRTLIVVVIQLSALMCTGTNGAIVPPPWSNTDKNPCAALPGGWQMLYWPPLKKCFKIFQVGYPCPDTMELSPPSSNDQSAECRCPPGTAQSITNNECHTLFTQGPCEEDEYFSPIADSRTLSTWKTGRVKKLGKCIVARRCPSGSIFWPTDEKCHALYTRGPCPKGKLLVAGINKIVGDCKCENHGVLAAYYYQDEDTCFEHFTKGPCQKTGDLFLPSRKCGCHPKLPQYHEKTNQCFEIGTSGPCLTGHIFTISEIAESTNHAVCVCKNAYIPWPDGACYRPYTRGPCREGEFLVNSTTCIPNFCGKGRLYFPEQNTCYKIGSQGPCPLHEVVVFDFTSRPSVDGISYNGVCGCTGLIRGLDQSCVSSKEENKVDACESNPVMVSINGICHKLYTQGPCGSGQWLEPIKLTSSEETVDTNNRAQCKCRPGYTSSPAKAGVTRCFAPSVGLARWILQLIGYDETT